ncbi:unnamed protein product [Lota lota]
MQAGVRRAVVAAGQTHQLWAGAVRSRAAPQITTGQRWLGAQGQTPPTPPPPPPPCRCERNQSPENQNRNSQSQPPDRNHPRHVTRVNRKLFL